MMVDLRARGYKVFAVGKAYDDASTHGYTVVEEIRNTME